MNAAIEIEGVGVQIGSNTILEDISTNITKGRITGLLGPSGAGKTTLYKSILGLKKINAGSIKILGKSAKDKKLHDNVGYMAQTPSIYYDLTINENLEYFSSISGASKGQIKKLLEAVELTHRQDTLVKNLSGGEKTRVSLVTALLGNPKVLLLDEPTVGLDPVLRDKLWKMFRQYAKKGKTIVVTSHIIDEANNCDDILFIRQGKLIASGSKRGVLKQGNAKTMDKAFLKLAGSKS